MNKLVRDYLCYTLAIMLICWGTCVLACNMGGISLSDNPLLYVPYLLGGWSPTIASFLSLKKNGRIANAKEWLRNVFDFRHGVVSYLVPVIFAFLFILPQCLVSGYKNGAPFFAIVFLIPLMLFGGGLEEAGWRYVLQPELEKKLGFTVSTITVSIIWWLWHLPLFHIPGTGQYGQNYFAFGINVLGLTFALASIKKNTGSVWLCVLFHCVANSLSAVFLIYDNIWGNVAAAAALIVCAYLLGPVYRRVSPEGPAHTGPDGADLPA